MKYIKQYENKSYYFSQEGYRKGDYVILLYSNEESVEYGFIAGKMYQIAQIDVTDYKFPYKLVKLYNENEEEDHDWVMSDAIRPAEHYEIDAIKYNI